MQGNWNTGIRFAWNHAKSVNDRHELFINKQPQVNNRKSTMICLWPRPMQCNYIGRTIFKIMERVGKHGTSKHGNYKTFILGEHEYYKHRVRIDGHVIWRCCKAKSLKCKANVTSDGLRIVQEHSEHNHQGNIARVLARKAVGQMKSVMTETLTRTGLNEPYA